MRIPSFDKIVILISSVLLVILTLFFSDGISWPDEIFQTVEPAYHFLTGSGHITWEFVAKVRSFLFPYALSFFIFVFQLFSESTPSLYYFLRVCIAIPFIISIYIAYLSFLK